MVKKLKNTLKQVTILSSDIEKKLKKLKYTLMVRKIEVTQVAIWLLHVNVCSRYTTLDKKIYLQKVTP